ncbi:hypothetical protein [Helicobacter enhydrae]|nr:hypothetical protein [Helicobacter enhydrae]
MREYLHTILTLETKSQLDAFVSGLQTIEAQEIEAWFVEDRALGVEVAQNLACKVLDLVLQKGELAHNTYLLLYVFYAPIVPSDGFVADERLTNYIQTAQQYFLGQNIGEYENLMLLELEVLCLMLQGEAQMAIKKYIQGVCHLQMHLSSAGQTAEFIRQFFPKLGISMEFFLESIKEILHKDHYMQLPMMRRRSILNWQLHCFWNVSSFFNHRSWLELYVYWKELFDLHLQDDSLESLDHCMYLQFFIYHMCGNSYESQKQWKEFLQEIDLVACRVYEDFAQKHALAYDAMPQTDKIVIGVLRDRLVENSPFKVEYSFMKQILQDEEFKQRYVIKIYPMNLLEKSENTSTAISDYEGLGIEIVDVTSTYNQDGFYNSHLQKALALAQRIKQDQVTYLISPNNGYGISDFVLSTRCAPYRIFWSHGNFVYDIPSLDCKITHICGNEALINREGNAFVGIPVAMDRRFYNPLVSDKLIASHRARFPKEALILGTIGRLVKINSLPYLQMLVRIMRHFPQSIYLACGSGNIAEIEDKLKSILGAEYAQWRERFYFCGYVDSGVYGHIIDFWLDSFPMEQGESRIEYVAKGKLSLVLVKNPQMVQKEWITMAVDEEDYYQKALHLLSLSKAQKDALIAENMAGLERYNEKRNKMGVSHFLNMLQSLCKES